MRQRRPRLADRIPFAARLQGERFRGAARLRRTDYFGERSRPAVSECFRDLSSADCTPWLAARLRTVFAIRAGKEVFVHKFTGWPRVGALREAFPDARFVHVVRDGRAVASSLVQMPWWDGWRGPSGWSFGPLPAELEKAWIASGQRFPVLAGIEWKLLVDAFEHARAQAGEETILEVRYEDFVADPARQLERILSFAGLESTAQFDRFSRRFPVQPNRAAAYVKELASEDLRVLDEVLGETLARYGYDVPASTGS